MRKALHILKNIIVCLIAALAVGMMIFTVVSSLTFNRVDRSLFGYRAFIVSSDSMSATDFSAGDLILVKEVDPATLETGDIISFQSTNTDNYGEVVTHKIRELATDAEGNPGFVTYGTTTGTNDENIVTYSYVLGKYTTSFPGVGYFFSFLKTTPGYILCIFLPFFLLILIQGINSVRLFRQYKKEQMAEMEEERKKQQEELERQRKELEAERAESQKMMAELMKLRQEMTGRPGARRTRRRRDDTAEKDEDEKSDTDKRQIKKEEQSCNKANTQNGR